MKQQTVVAVHTHTHTSNFIEIKRGNKAFICDITDRLFKK